MEVKLVDGSHANLGNELDQGPKKVSTSFDGRCGECFAVFLFDPILDFDVGPMCFVGDEEFDPGDSRLVV